MIGFITAVLLATQPQANTPPGAPLRSDDPPSRELSAAHDLFYEDEERPNSDGARQALEAFGTCLAERNAVVARSTLAMDFNSRIYSNRLRQLSRGDRDCFRERGSMRFGNLALAGAMAERLIERDPAPLNVRLARAALGPAATTYSPTDRIAMCVVRSVPDQVAALFASPVVSSAEADAARALEPAFNACNQARTGMTMSVAGARAMLATAAYRSLRAGPAVTANRD
jgi:hypothetical protein